MKNEAAKAPVKIKEFVMVMIKKEICSSSRRELTIRSWELQG